MLSGKREAMLSALGVVSGIHHPDGIVGDLGGGSLELIDVRGRRIGPARRCRWAASPCRTSPRNRSSSAEEIVARELARVPSLKSGARPHLLCGWRHVARDCAVAHVADRLSAARHARLFGSAEEVLEFARLVRRVDADTLSKIEVVADARRPLLAYAAMVLEQLVRMARAEGGRYLGAGRARRSALFELRDEEQQQGPAARRGAGTQCAAFARAAAWRRADRVDRPVHGASGLDETAEEKRLRHAACLLADIGWRAHPDYRGEQSLNIIANAAFVGVDHPGRAFIALAVYFRHVGLIDDELSPHVRELATTRMLDRARVLGAAMRVAYSFRRPCRACCRTRRWWSSAAA